MNLSSLHQNLLDGKVSSAPFDNVAGNLRRRTRTIPQWQRATLKGPKDNRTLDKGLRLSCLHTECQRCQTGD